MKTVSFSDIPFQGYRGPRCQKCGFQHSWGNKFLATVSVSSGICLYTLFRLYRPRWFQKWRPFHFPTYRFWDTGAPPPAEIGFRTYLEQLIAGLQSQFRAEFAYIPFLDYIDLADSKNEDRFLFPPPVSEILGPPSSKMWFSIFLGQ